MNSQYLQTVKFFNYCCLVFAVIFPAVGIASHYQAMEPKGAIYYKVNTKNSIYYAKFNHSDMDNFFAFPGRDYERRKAYRSIPTGTTVVIDLYDHHNPEISTPVGQMLVILPKKKDVATTGRMKHQIDGFHKNVTLRVTLEQSGISHKYTYTFESH